MFFLLRMAFWIGLVLVLLPSDRPANESAATQVNAGDAISAASAAVSDMSQFCTRQPAACAVGGQAATVIGQRAQAGARKLYHIITEKKGDHTGSIGETAAVPPPDAGDTLSPADLQIGWQGPVPLADPDTPEAPAGRG